MSTIADKIARRVGRTVKARREELRLTLRALAAKSRVSPSMISDVERGAKSPTLATLAALAAALGIPLPSLIDAAAPATSRIRVIRGAERRELVDPASGTRHESFGAGLAGSKVEFLRYVVPPRSMAGPFPPHPRGTIEHIHVAAGAVQIVVGEEAVTLAAGDSCSCHADARHLFDNRDGGAEALLYVIIEGGS